MMVFEIPSRCCIVGGGWWIVRLIKPSLGVYVKERVMSGRKCEYKCEITCDCQEFGNCSAREEGMAEV